jgi:ATPase subunit of ABC transporter with duplicated ATPase domains
VESAESQVKLLERPRDYTVVFSFPPVVAVNPPILEVRDCNFRYNENLPWLFRQLNFGLDMSSRVCIVGANGSGTMIVVILVV